MRTTPADTVRCRFFAPVDAALGQIDSTRRCPGFADTDYLESGVGRVISDAQSGRDWVQRLRLWIDARLSVSNFFDALKSPRRLRFLFDVSEHVRRALDADAQGDPLAPHRELDGFEVYASDGHFEQGSAHPLRAQLKGQPACTFFSLNLRSHSMNLLDIARPRRKREHDMRALKRVGSTRLRFGAPKGRKVLHVYDPAGLDYAQWHAWKARGVYFLSREKKNSAAYVVGLSPWDRSDPKNRGVLSDELIGTSGQRMLRRVHYRDASSGVTYAFLTNEMTLAPGLIAFLYKLRWDIEKVFDQKKNKLQEKKAWAASEVARCQQALFLGLAHNLMVLFERELQRQEGLRDFKCEEKRRRRLEELKKALRARGQPLNPLVEHCTRITQRSLQFVRWLRACLFTPTPYSVGLAHLRPLMERYLS